ncbi:MAG: hypothetical protein A2452_11055 [Candidatus Firestonebacteria bacterium RIFOXYC2_FULL_39_67]|nr:MAG: hypothetical protein A2452_11055 [Candidatus Firestonebacteria bacterium RIFOXYC2_FULL_39_67]
MHKLTFFPLGNADCCLIELEDKRKILFDYAHCKVAEDEDDLRSDLFSLLQENLKKEKRDYFDIVAFTHADEDHISNFSEFFFLEHAQKYQDDKRIKIKELWVPAAVIIEEDIPEEAKILRAEARYRLKKGKGIRVFSAPDTLKSWFESEKIKYEERKDLITNAGQTVPGFDKTTGNVEIFVHSPFAIHSEDEKLVDRNQASLVMQIIFSCDGQDTKFILSGDTECDVWKDIVKVTKYHKREERLNWDIVKLPHHCSYKSLSAEVGKEKTVPEEEINWLFEQGNEKGIIVSTSDIIPSNDQEQPPHRQAANYYKEIASKINGEFIVTMEHPQKTNPKPLVISIDKFKATIAKTNIVGGAAIISRAAPRAG